MIRLSTNRAGALSRTSGCCFGAAQGLFDELLDEAGLRSALGVALGTIEQDHHRETVLHPDRSISLPKSRRVLFLRRD